MADYSNLTIMLSLPRSRSAWMVEFLRPFVHASWHCPLQQCGSIEELKAKVDAALQLGGPVFIADVAALFFFDKLLLAFPGAQYIVVSRPAREVEASMRQLGISPPLNVANASKQLEDIGLALRGGAAVRALTGTFFELNSPSVLQAIVRLVTHGGTVAGSRYLYGMMQKNIQVSVEDQRLRTDIVKQRQLFGQAKIIH